MNVASTSVAEAFDQAAFAAIPADATPEAAPQPPTAEEIDALVAEFETAHKASKDADEVLGKVKSRLITAVDSFGHVPPNAEQSKRLTGRHNVATVTRGTTVTVNEDAVTSFAAFLAEKHLSDFFPRFFSPQTKHVLVEGAREVLKTVALPRRIEEKIAALFGKAFDVKAKSPSLKVELIQPEKPARKPKAGKKVA